MKLYKLMMKLATEILPLVFWVLLLFGFDKVYMAVITIIAAILHEAGHYTAIKLLKCDTGTPIGHFSGFRIRQKQTTSYSKNILVLLSGPLANLVFSCLLFPFAFKSNYIAVVCLINFATAVSNLLPIRGYDGYTILEELFKSRYFSSGLKALNCISFSLSVTLAFLALYMMYYLNEGYWLFAIFIVNLLSEMSRELKMRVCANY